MRDISARKNKEFEINKKNKILENQNSELEQFTYITSHDLQEPLVTLMSFSDLLLEEFSDSLDPEEALIDDNEDENLDDFSQSQLDDNTNDT